MEQSGDVVDELEPTEIAEVAGRCWYRARRDAEASSRAADRRTEALMRGTASPVANDPIDW